MTDESITPEYHYGYGHGYHRFVTILGQLERYRERGVLYRYAGIGCISNSPERGAEPAYERFRYFHDTVQRDL